MEEERKRVYENYCIGDAIRFKYEDREMTGTIESATQHQIIIKPDKECGRFYDGYRITISKNDLYMSHTEIKRKSSTQELTRNEDGSYSL